MLPPVVELSDEELVERQPKSVADAVRALPGVSVRTNSRGETIARVRGSEERQTQLFLDGAPLAIPWDGRVDIGIIPTGLIGTVRATKGAVPIEYGANAVAGVIDLQTRGAGSAGVRAMGSAGPLGFSEGSAIGSLATGGLDVSIAAGALTRDAERIASRDALPFSQPDGKRRVNTDLDSVSLFGAAEYAGGPLLVRAAFLRFDAERGIAPESDRDPAVNAPRFWRYPDISHTQLNLASDLELSEQSSLRFVGWRQWFDQTIEQYTDVSYSTVRAREDDEDDTLGGRFVLTTALAPFNVRLVASGQTSRHAQVDRTFPAAPGPRLIYRQDLFTIGGEADARLGPGSTTLGVAYDHSANPRTGDKPNHPDRGALAFSAAYRLPLGQGWIIAASGGRRSRFPSARELFGEALGRFLPNPDLKPEQAWLADAQLDFAASGVAFQINPFLAVARDTIAQRVVRVNGRNLRQRYNLSGSTSLGVDALITAQVTNRVGVEFSGTLLRARADQGAAAFRRLPQRPTYEVAAAAILEPVDAVALRAELRRVGPAVDLDPNGSRARLAPGNEVNLRGRWQLGQVARGAKIALTASIENLTDDVITPQLGLPLAGRSARIGLQIN